MVGEGEGRREGEGCWREQVVELRRVNGYISVKSVCLAWAQNKLIMVHINENTEKSKAFCEESGSSL